jgi:hypothetical protein
LLISDAFSSGKITGDITALNELIFVIFVVLIKLLPTSRLAIEPLEIVFIWEAGKVSLTGMKYLNQ